jgi:hypothetical protein
MSTENLEEILGGVRRGLQLVDSAIQRWMAEASTTYQLSSIDSFAKGAIRQRGTFVDPDAAIAAGRQIEKDEGVAAYVTNGLGKSLWWDDEDDEEPEENTDDEGESDADAEDGDVKEPT